MADLTRRRSVATAVAVVLLLALTAGVWWMVFARTTPGSADQGSPAAGPATGTATAPGGGSTPSPSRSSGGPSTSAKVAVFLGDGAVQGLAGGDAVTNRWSTAVARGQGWTEDNLGRAGTGYAATPTDPAVCWMASCPPVPHMIADAVAARPAVVVVSAGAADLALLPDSAAAVRTAVNRTYRELSAALPHARVIALSPMWSGTDPAPAELTTLDGWVRSAARRYGAEYVPGGASWLAGTPDATTDGDLSEAGHLRVAAVLDRWLRRND